MGKEGISVDKLILNTSILAVVCALASSYDFQQGGLWHLLLGYVVRLTGMEWGEMVKI